MTRRIGIAGIAFPQGTALAEQAAEIRRHGFLRLDPRVAADDGIAPTARADELAGIRRMLDGEGVRIGCLYGYPGDGSDHVRRLAGIAEALGADAVRVQPGRLSVEDCTELFAAAVGADGSGPGFVLQNHPGSSLDLRGALGVVRTLDHPRLRLACSPDHETVAGRWDAGLLAEVAPWTAVWMWSDVAQGADGRWAPCLPGRGAVPWSSIIAAVHADPAAIISCKWERRWHPELPMAPEALPVYQAHLAPLAE